MYYDLLARIKNAARARKDTVLTPFSEMDFAVAKALREAGFVGPAEKRVVGKKSVLEIKLRYQGDAAALSDFRIKSRPSRRLYRGYRDLRSVRQGYGAAVLSTPSGVMTDREARKKKVGGEYLFEVW